MSIQPYSLAPDAGGTFGTATELAFNTPHTETLGLNGDLADCYKLTLTNGIFQIIGSVSSSLKVKATFYNSDGKKAASISVSGGKFSMKPATLEAGTYYLMLESKDKGKSAGEYTLSVTGTRFPAPVQNNTLHDATRLPLSTEGLGGTNGWVGLGDSIDYYRIDPARAGNLFVSITGLSAKVKVTLYRADGRKLKSISLSKANTDVFKGGYLLEGAAYLSVESGDRGKGKQNTGYTLDIRNDYFPAPTDNNSREEADLLTLNKDGFAAADGWVGVGDSVDYYRIDPASAGRLYVGVTGLSAKVKLTLYRADGKKIKSVSLSKDNSDAFKGGILLDVDTACISVESGDKGKGKQNTEYTLTVNDHYFPAATDNNSVAEAEWIDLDRNGRASVSGWVGFGDAADCYRIDPLYAGTVSITISDVSAKLKVTLYSQGKKIKTLSVRQGSASFDSLLLPAMPVYILVESGDKGKGKQNSSYTIDVADSYLPAPGTNNDRTTATRMNWDGEGAASVTDWVGFDDKTDFFRFELDKSCAVDLNLVPDTPGIQVGRQLKVTLYNEAGKKLKLDDALSSQQLDAAVYFVSVEISNPKKYSTGYRLDVQQLA
ncbi:MAG: hypothetical protein HPZ91_19740 [Lentisphaeria bacterium]|nr:hypothetical protein [Lentisphaeria bacterium]